MAKSGSGEGDGNGLASRGSGEEEDVAGVTGEGLAEGRASGIAIESLVARCTLWSGTRAIGAPNPKRRAWPRVSRAAGRLTGPPGDSTSRAAGASRFRNEVGLARCGFDGTGIGSASGGRLTKRCMGASGATTGSSRAAAVAALAGKGVGRAGSSTAASPSHSPDSVTAPALRRWTRGRGIIAGPSLRVAGRAIASTNPVGASALT